MEPLPPSRNHEVEVDVCGGGRPSACCLPHTHLLLFHDLRIVGSNVNWFMIGISYSEWYLLGPLTLSLVPSFWLQVHIRVTLPSCLRSCYRLHLTGRIVSWRGEDGLQDTNFLSNATGNEGSKEAVLSWSYFTLWVRHEILWMVLFARAIK